MMDTSIEAYRAAQASGLIGRRQMQVVEYMVAKHPVVTSQGEVGRHFNDASSSFQPRFRELEHAGVIEQVCQITDPVTNHKVKAYRLTGEVPKTKVRAKRSQARCPHCGEIVK